MTDKWRCVTISNSVANGGIYEVGEEGDSANELAESAY